MDFVFEYYRILATYVNRFNQDSFKKISTNTAEIVHDYGIRKVCRYFKTTGFPIGRYAMDQFIHTSQLVCFVTPVHDTLTQAS